MKFILLTPEQHHQNLHAALAYLSDDRLKEFYFETKENYERMCVRYFECNKNDFYLRDIERYYSLLESIKARMKHLNILSEITVTDIVDKM
jgi:hypothetical protein